MSDLWGIGYLIYSSNSGQGFSHLIFMEFKGKDLCITACGQHGFISTTKHAYFYDAYLTLAFDYIMIYTRPLANIKQALAEIVQIY